MSKRYLIKIRNTELWLKQNLNFSPYAPDRYTISIVIDPLCASRWETYRSAQQIIKEHMPAGDHCSIHILSPLTEQVPEEPKDETLVVSAEVAKETLVKIEEADEGLIARVMKKVKS